MFTHISRGMLHDVKFYTHEIICKKNSHNNNYVGSTPRSKKMLVKQALKMQSIQPYKVPCTFAKILKVLIVK